MEHVAQSVEHLTFNQVVVGSIPTVLTNFLTIITNMEIKINSRSGINSAIAQFKKETKKNAIVIEARIRMYNESSRQKAKRKTEERIRRRMQAKARN